MTVDAKAELLETLRRDLEAAADTLDPPPVLRFRPMFGGVGVYADGPMFATLSEAGMALGLPPADRQELTEAFGAVPLRYRPDAPVSKSKVVVPDAVRRDPERLGGWLAKSIAFAAAAPPKSRAKPKGRSRAT